MDPSSYQNFLAARRRNIQKLLSEPADGPASTAATDIDAYVSPLESSTLGLSERLAFELKESAGSTAKAPASAAQKAVSGPPKSLSVQSKLRSSNSSASGSTTAIASNRYQTAQQKPFVAKAASRPVAAPLPSGSTANKRAVLPPTMPSAEEIEEEMQIYATESKINESLVDSTISHADDATTMTGHADIRDSGDGAMARSQTFAALLRSSSPIQSPAKKATSNTADTASFTPDNVMFGRASTASLRTSIGPVAVVAAPSPSRISREETAEGKAGFDTTETAIGQDTSPQTQTQIHQFVHGSQEADVDAGVQAQRPVDSTPQRPVLPTPLSPSPSIRRFLMEIEADDGNSDSIPRVPRHESMDRHVRRSAPSIEIAEPSDAPSAGAAIRAQATAMQLEIDEKTRQVAILRAQLRQAQKMMADQLDAHNKEQEDLRKRQEAEFQASLAQHVTFIDTLLADKKVLAAQVAALTDQLAAVTTATESKIGQLTQHFRSELQSAKEQWELGEKARREKWQQQQMKDLREKTIRGLEPDINRMIERHKEEIAKLQAAAQEQIANVTVRLEEEKAAAVRQAREEFFHSADSANEYDKQAWRAREKSLRAEYDSELSSMRLRYSKDIEDERRRGMEAVREAHQSHFQEIATMQKEFQAKLHEVAQQHNAERDIWSKQMADEVKSLQQRLDEEKRYAENRLQLRLQEEISRRETELRAESNRSRDEQIRIVIAKCDEEMAEFKRRVRQECQASVEEKMAEYDDEVGQLHHQVEEWQHRYEEAAASRDAALKDASAEATKLGMSLEHASAEIDRLKIENTAQKTLIEAAKTHTADQQAAFDAAKAALQEQHGTEMQRLRAEIETVNQQIRSLESTHTSELATFKKAKNDELETVEARVKAALRKRDDIIMSLRTQVEEEKAKAEAAKRMMIQQRRELMGASIDFST